MTSASNHRSVQAASAPADASSLLAIIDFSYQHYALGDLLTTQVELATIAIELKLDQIDVLAMTNPRLPSAHFQQFITSDNYVSYLDGIVPAVSCNPMLRTLQIIRDVATFNHAILSRRASGAPMWPDLRTHLKMRQDYPIGHRHLNAFYARHGYLPQLRAPRDYEAWARRFHQSELGGRPLAIVNPRQSSLTSNPAATYRDAPLESWHSFIDVVAGRQPEVLFVMVGGYQEWEHRLLQRANVFVPRAFGLSLAHELALMKIARLFMGSSSGFATFATFTDIAYGIVDCEHRFAAPAGITPGDRHYPFARANQILVWHRETTEVLLALFAELYANLAVDDVAAGAPAASVDSQPPKVPRP
jgi:hypothetical protein